MFKVDTLCKAGVIAAAALFSATVLAAPQFKVPVHYSVELVDGETNNLPYSRSDRTITFDGTGRHQIVLLFEDNFGTQAESRMVQAADPIVIDIMSIGENDLYTFTYDQPHSLKEAELYARTQQIELRDGNHKPLNPEQATYYILASEAGFSILRDYRQDLLSLNRLYAPRYVQGQERVMGLTTYGAPTITANAGAGFNSGTPAHISMAAPMTSSAQEGNLRTSSTSGGAVAGPQGRLRDLINLYNSSDDATKLEFVKYVMSH